MSVLQKKISRLALFDGGGLVGMGFLSLVFAVIWRDPTGAMVGLALVTLGGIELRGRWFLRKREKRATGWLVGSQLGLLFVILAYCLRSLAHPPALHFEQIPAAFSDILTNLPGYENDLAGVLQPMLKIVYSLLMLVSVFYQGGMAMFYLRKTPLVLQDPPPLPTEL